MGLSVKDKVISGAAERAKAAWTASHSHLMLLEGSECSNVFSTFKHKTEDLISLSKTV